MTKLKVFVIVEVEEPKPEYREQTAEAIRSALRNVQMPGKVASVYPEHPIMKIYGD